MNLCVPWPRPAALMAALAGCGALPAQEAKPPNDGVRLEGRVVDVLGEPLPLARVRVQHEGREIANVQCDGQGSFVVPRLPRDEVWVYAAAAQHAGARQCVDLDRPADGHVVVLMLLDGAPVRGKVLDEHGAPIAGARVLAVPAGDYLKYVVDDSFVETDAQGRYELTVVLGENRVIAFAAGRVPAEATVQVLDPQTADLALESAPSCVVRVQFQGATPELFGGMKFWWQGPRWEGLGRSWPVTQHDDVVEFQGVPLNIGVHMLSAFSVHSRIEPTLYPMPDEPGEHTIHAKVTPWGEGPKVEVRGRLVDTDKHPVAGCRLTHWVGPALTDECVTDADGAFAMKLRAANDKDRVALDSDDYVASTERAQQDGPFYEDWFQIELHGKELALVAERAASITGRLVDAMGAPIFDAAVDLLPDSRHEVIRRVFTGRDGSFAMRRLRGSSLSGTWLRLSSPYGEHATKPLHLRVGEVLALGTIALAKPNGIEGTLLDGHGEPRRCIPVHLFRAETAQSFDGYRVGYTDRLGRFRFRGLPPGTYDVKVDPPSIRLEWPSVASVTLREGDRATVIGDTR
jgi:protocatechuate 3,4-dioxygenase beta subunit